jgi:hypothetical protein
MTLSLAQHNLLDEVRSPTCGTRCPARELAALHTPTTRACAARSTPGGMRPSGSRKRAERGGRMSRAKRAIRVYAVRGPERALRERRKKKTPSSGTVLSGFLLLRYAPWAQSGRNPWHRAGASREASGRAPRADAPEGDGCRSRWSARLRARTS